MRAHTDVLTSFPRTTQADIPRRKHGIKSPVYRDASLTPNWLANPDGYTIITACGPTEKAKEIEINGEFHGLLSYFLVETFLKLKGVGGKLQYIQQVLRARVQSTRERYGHQQTPMVLGNKTLNFFGYANPLIGPAPIPVVRFQDGSVQLQAGEAHGICEGDTFSLSAIAFDDATSLEPITHENYCTATATSVNALTSLLSLSMTITADDPTLSATPIIRLALQTYPIRLQINEPYPQSWKEALDSKRSLRVYSGHQVDLEDRYFSFTVTSSDHRSYEIRDETDQLLLEIADSFIESDDNTALVSRVLEHLTSFHVFKRLMNSDPQDLFSQSFSARILGNAGKEAYPGCSHDRQLRTVCSHRDCILEVNEGTKLLLEVKSHETKEGHDLYLHPFNMGSSWQVENISGGDYIVLPPPKTHFQTRAFKAGTTGVWEKKLKMTFPSALKEKGKDYCDDIIKIFVTRQPTSFLSLELPKLDNVRTSAKSGAHRGASDSHMTEDWDTVTFRIRTRPQEP